MDGKERREEILSILRNSKVAVSGSGLAKKLGVSRQVIVQDIALLRAVDKNILATSKGYMLFQSQEKYFRCLTVMHTPEQIEDELLTIINLGGHVLDVIVAHDVYGQISVDLNIETVVDVRDFCQKISQSNSKPLNILADGMHMHTIEATSIEKLDRIEEALLTKGYLRMEETF